MFCSNCGKEIDDKAVICPGCGVPVAGAQQPYMNQQCSNGDAPSTGFAVLGFFFPLIGLILYLVWKAQTPLKAKSCIKGALAGFITNIVLLVIGGCISVMAASY